MASGNLSNLDLNLLVVFDALMIERSATGAGRRLGMTQPAVSHALGRLRSQFEDELFVRSPRGMQPTPRARELAGPIRQALGQLEGLMTQHEAFQATSSERVFRVGASDYGAFVMLPALLRRLSVVAPGVRLTLHNANQSEAIAMLERDQIELAIGNFAEPPPAWTGNSLLFMDSYLCVGRKGHPAFDAPLTLDTYLELNHIHVVREQAVGGFLDRQIAHLGRHRRLVATVGHFLLPAFIAAGTDLVATGPRRLMEPLTTLLHLESQPVPLELPRFPVVQVWAHRNRDDPGHQWLRGVVEAVAESL